MLMQPFFNSVNFVFKNQLSLILTTHLLILHAWSDAVMSYYLTDLYLNPTHWSCIRPIILLERQLRKSILTRSLTESLLLFTSTYFPCHCDQAPLVSVCYQWVAINGRDFTNTGCKRWDEVDLSPEISQNIKYLTFKFFNADNQNVLYTKRHSWSRSRVTCLHAPCLTLSH